MMAAQHGAASIGGNQLAQPTFPGWPCLRHGYMWLTQSAAPYLIRWFRTSYGFPMVLVFGTRRTCRQRTFNGTRPLFGMTRASASNSWSQMQIIVPPGGNPVLASWDRPFFYISDPNAYPSTYGPVDGRQYCRGLVSRLCIVEPELSRGDCRLVGR